MNARGSGKFESTSKRLNQSAYSWKLIKKISIFVDCFRIHYSSYNSNLVETFVIWTKAKLFCRHQESTTTPLACFSSFFLYLLTDQGIFPNQLLHSQWHRSIVNTYYLSMSIHVFFFSSSLWLPQHRDIRLMIIIKNDKVRVAAIFRLFMCIYLLLLWLWFSPLINNNVGSHFLTL